MQILSHCKGTSNTSGLTGQVVGSLVPRRQQLNLDMLLTFSIYSIMTVQNDGRKIMESSMDFIWELLQYFLFLTSIQYARFLSKILVKQYLKFCQINIKQFSKFAIRKAPSGMDTLLADYSVDFMTIIDGAQWRRVRNSSWGSANYKLQGC